MLVAHWVVCWVASKDAMKAVDSAACLVAHSAASKEMLTVVQMDDGLVVESVVRSVVHSAAS